MGKIIVAGSSNIDMTAYVRSLPRPGETVGGGRFRQTNGGKGANQAVAAGRLGGDVLFLTCVGDDLQGHMLKETFAADGIDTSLMKFSGTSPTGTALIFVADDGENCIAVAPGANGEFLPQDIDAAGWEIALAQYLLLQLEIPLETVFHAVNVAYRAGVRIILNPAPISEPIPSEVLSKLWLITPNETEAEKLTGIRINYAEDARRAAETLIAQGVENVIITLGSAGSLVCRRDSCDLVPARPVTAVDTVGAGDVYNGALVTALSEGKSLIDAARFATVASSIAVTRPGAQSGVPSRYEVDEILNS
ncbi:MAG: ribokinase [Bacteroidales bacterium]|nr:ribokinase [Bacteroidales bacterium]